MSILPIFLPQMGCKRKCIFCDQRSATGITNAPSLYDLDEKVKDYKRISQQFEIAFYGGTFTALPYAVQLSYLEWAKRYIDEGVCKGIRISTRPDEISEEKIIFLKRFRVSFVEIGAQSFDEDVLRASKRGHTVEDIERACQILRDLSVDFGIHLMIGLPNDDRSKDIHSAWEVVEVGAKTCRIHPTLVLRDSGLAKLYSAGQYQPLSLEEAIEISSEMTGILEANNVRVIRIGLFIPNELQSNVIAGPYHPRFGELVKIKLLEQVIDFLKPQEISYTNKQESIMRALGLKGIVGNCFGFVVNDEFLEWKDALKKCFGGVKGVRETEERCTTTN
ncbi:MAG: radical SAM protein [Pseudothermotoga sp.]